MGRGRSRQGGRHGDSARVPAMIPLAEARKLKQQAERKPIGDDREQLLMRCVEIFESSLQQQQHISQSDYEESLFDLAESFYLWATSIKTSASKNSLTPLKGNITKEAAINVKMQAFARAADLFRKSFETYDKLRLSDMKEESLVNSGNSLSDWAEIILELPQALGGGIHAAIKLYSDAYDRYAAALEIAREDIETLTNYGDCCVRRAELSLQCQPSSWDSAKSLYDQGLEAYSIACSVCDYRMGDDLCGLLQNWGAGFASKAKHVPKYMEALQYITCAREKLQSAAKLNPTDVSLFNALGELSITESERLPDQPPFYEKVYNCMLAAIESFTTVLKIDSGNMDALLGNAEAHELASKSLRLVGNTQESFDHSLQSTNFYMKCIELLKADTESKYDLDYVQQCEILFNLACAAAHCGREQDATGALTLLVNCQAVTSQELEDPDLEIFKSRQWFIFLSNTIR